MQAAPRPREQQLRHLSKVCMRLASRLHSPIRPDRPLIGLCISLLLRREAAMRRPAILLAALCLCGLALAKKEPKVTSKVRRAL